MSYIFNFGELNLPEKIHLFEDNWSNIFLSIDGLRLNQFLRKVIFDSQENSFIRRKALQNYIDAVLLQKIKIRQALALLVDDWQENEEIFLEIQRVKSLFLFYDYEPELIEQILQDHTKSIEGELSSEAFYTLGLIFFQKALTSNEHVEATSNIKNCREAFSTAMGEVENRIDAEILFYTTEVLDELHQGHNKSAKIAIEKVSHLIFRQALFTFGPETSAIYIGFYRTLNHLIKVLSEEPSSWLNFREDIDRLYYYYSAIQNTKIERRLNEGSLADAFRATLQKEFIEPFFALNLESEKSRILGLISEVKDEIEKTNFLNHLIELLDKDGAKDKALSITIEQRLKNIFIDRPSDSIERAISKISDPGSVQQLLGAYEELATPSIQQFIDKLIYSCAMLQGNRLYWGSFSEDDRNTYISNMIESAGFRVKDQTRWSISNAGKSSGEIDILVKDIHGMPFTIIEALNLDSLKAQYLILHLNKLFNYDANGLQHNFILVYSDAKKFDKFWKSYYEFVKDHQYPFTLITIEELSLAISDIKMARSVHSRNGSDSLLFHIVIDLNK